jgi:hypothetical protein
MVMPNSSFVLLYASLARAPEFAMGLASRMAATAFEHSDLDGVQRWSRCYAQLNSLYEREVVDTAV